jgi:twinkle protein
MNNIVGSELCPACRETGHDKTGNHLIIFSDGNKYCNRARHHKSGQSYLELNHKLEEGAYTELTFEEIKELPFNKLPSRDIPQGVCEIYGVRVSFSEENGDIDTHYYPLCNSEYDTTAYKVRRLPKKFFIIGNKPEAVLFGQSITAIQNAKEIIITGGEEDALAATTMTGRRLQRPIYGVAPPYGENLSFSEIPEVIQFLKNKSRIYLALDNDEAGEKLTRKLIDLLGTEKVRVVNFSEKDVSDMLTREKEREFIDAIFSAKEYRPSSIITVEDVWEDAIKMPEWGISWPWPSLTKATYGIRRGEVYYTGAGVKIGKSEMEKQLIQHLIIEHGLKVGAIFPEEAPQMSYKKIAGKLVGKQFHIPDSGFTQEELIDAMKLIKDNVLLHNRYASIEWEEVKEFIRYCVVSKGIKDIIIDPITCLTDGKDSSEADRLLKQVTRELDYMVKDLNFSLYIFHLNAPKSAKPHEEGGEVRSAQFANSRAMMRVAQFMVGIERNKKAENPIERNTSTFVLLEDRNFGNYVRFPVYYDKDTGLYLEPKGRI